jgi:V/A-type H+-transporting ATPase subunit C
VVIGYLAARESELTAVRIIMTGRLAGLKADLIRERLREAYV